MLVASATLHGVAASVGNDLPLRLVFGGGIDGFDSFEAALAGARPRLTEQPCGAVMLYSSGTTGFPKGIQPELPRRSVEEPGDPIVAIASALYGINGSDVYYSPAPIYHAAPLRWCAMVHALGGTVVLAKRFDAERTLEHIERYRVTVTQMVPTMFVRLLKLDADVPHPIRRVQPARGDPRCRTVPCRREAGDDRLARSDHLRVLQLDRGARDDVHRQRGLAATPGVGRP